MGNLQEIMRFTLVNGKFTLRNGNELGEQAVIQISDQLRKELFFKFWPKTLFVEYGLVMFRP